MGVNNIPIDLCSERGIVVFNTPGANANAVKELVLAGLMLSSRNVFSSIDFVNSLKHIEKMEELVPFLEENKKKFKGRELSGSTLGVVGLGDIGSKVAGMGVAKAVEDFMKIEKCLPLDESEDSKITAKLENEFTDQS